MVPPDAEKLTEITQQQVSKWRRRLEDRGVAFPRALGYALRTAHENAL
jgi:hypothetical protein